MKKSLRYIAAAVLAATSFAASAAVSITEVAPWSSGNSPVAADWFELTNTGSSAVDITGWKFDDSSASFAAGATLNGISSIAAGQSVIFLEGNSAKVELFKTNWFGANVPSSLVVGYYSGSGIGLSTTSDAVNIFNASGALQASVTFGASDSSLPYQTFDNAAGLNNTSISQLSVVDISGAFVAANSVNEIGSPGSIAAVPEPETYAMLLAGLGFIGALARKRQR
ncbi:MAG: lamin tail domain-containing protein [Gammaproteobacteria bacterium]|nr:lamin tail domain-containing protein [Gammaproteobacteria bacterium]MBU1600996.1 lamin tail domain-containing protein [Gammaproteobacteria bacterium]MBU2434355.1 lamin tail domain-containing protein [Gammaproteobacteria bacterium]MBU2450759.1 lamin tail domain-containing protein [Gammaproteobacteria bacterium]